MTTATASLALLAASALLLAGAPPAGAVPAPPPRVLAAPLASVATTPPSRVATTPPSPEAGTLTAAGTASQTPRSGVWPLLPRPEVVSGFAPPLSRYGAGHRGVDLLGSPDQKVHAAAGGLVTYAGSLAGRGVVVVSHGTTRTTYEPVQATVRRGSSVEAGDVVGTLQTFGSHCAPGVCLHWGLLEGESYLDPLTLVGAGPVRLLPLVGPAAGSPAGIGPSGPTAMGGRDPAR